MNNDPAPDIAGALARGFARSRELHLVSAQAIEQAPAPDSVIVQRFRWLISQPLDPYLEKYAVSAFYDLPELVTDDAAVEMLFARLQNGEAL